ncbi:MAG: XdhC family protein, partial [Alphaproteobacteria bacterium]
PERFPETRILTEWAETVLPGLAPDSRTAVITLTHDPKLDEPALAAALRSPAFYIGALGSRRSAVSRNKRLARLGFSDAEIGRIHGPVGLPLGAVTPAEIAVAILAEAVKVLRTGIA